MSEMKKNPVDSLVLINVICIAYKVENILKGIIQMFAHLIAYITIFTCPSVGICGLDFFVQKGCVHTKSLDLLTLNE